MARVQSNLIQAFKNFILFAFYISALSGIAWYAFQYPNETHNTFVTDLLLTTSFAVTFPILMMLPQHCSKKHDPTFKSAFCCNIPS